MSQFYALMPDNTVKYISLKEDVVDEIRNIFIRGAEKLKPQGIEEDRFNGDLVARKGENITYVSFELPDGFSRIPDNQADISDYDITKDVPKSIFWYEGGKFFFQVFNKRNILKRRTVLKIEVGNSFAKMQENAFVIEEMVNAIYEDKKLYFQSYTTANQIFSLLDFVTEATNGDIDSFGENVNLQADAEVIKGIANVKTRRLIKVLSSTENVLRFSKQSYSKKVSLLKKYGVEADLDDSGKLVLPTNNVSKLNRTLEFLNEDIFSGVITQKIYKSNSKKIDQ